MGPLQSIIQWFDGLPVELQEDVAFLTLAVLQEHRPPPVDAIELRAAFRDWLNAHSSPHAELGRALSFIAAFEYLFGPGLSAQGWLDTRRLIELIADGYAADGARLQAEFARRRLETLKAREPLWKAQAAGWGALKNEHLSWAPLARWTHRADASREASSWRT
jgi:hypothetical protein